MIPWNAIGEVLLHSLWQGTVIALIAALFLRMMRDRDARERYAVCGLALFAVAVAPVFTFYWLATQGHAHEPIAVTATPVVMVGALPEVPAEAPGLLTWAAWIWLAGVAVSQLRLAVGFGRLSRLKRQGIQPVERHYKRLLADLCESMGLRRKVKLFASSRVTTPSLVGFLEPVVLVPIGMMNALSTEEVRAVLAHELAHLKRLDPLVNALQSLVEALLFFHPAVWWLSSRVRVEREFCCDDLATRAQAGGVHLARALARLEGERQSGEVLVLSSHGGSLMQRVQRLVKPGRRGRASLLAPTLFSVLAIGLTAGSATAWSAAADDDCPRCQRKAEREKRREARQARKTEKDATQYWLTVLGESGAGSGRYELMENLPIDLTSGEYKLRFHPEGAERHVDLSLADPNVPTGIAHVDNEGNLSRQYVYLVQDFYDHADAAGRIQVDPATMDLIQFTADGNVELAEEDCSDVEEQYLITYVNSLEELDSPAEYAARIDAALKEMPQDYTAELAVPSAKEWATVINKMATAESVDTYTWVTAETEACDEPEVAGTFTLSPGVTVETDGKGYFTVAPDVQVQMDPSGRFLTYEAVTGVEIDPEACAEADLGGSVVVTYDDAGEWFVNNPQACTEGAGSFIVTYENVGEWVAAAPPDVDIVTITDCEGEAPGQAQANDLWVSTAVKPIEWHAFNTNGEVVPIDFDPSDHPILVAPQVQLNRAVPITTTIAAPDVCIPVPTECEAEPGECLDSFKPTAVNPVILNTPHGLTTTYTEQHPIAIRNRYIEKEEADLRAEIERLKQQVEALEKRIEAKRAGGTARQLWDTRKK